MRGRGTHFSVGECGLDTTVTLDENTLASTIVQAGSLVSSSLASGGQMANPLTLLLPLVPNTDPIQVASLITGNQDASNAALTSIGTVHFARFLLLDSSVPNLQPSGACSDSLVLGVITEYDGDFDAYISDFASKIGFIFDALLPFVVGGSGLVPVAQNVNAFTTFIQQNDASQNPAEPQLYSAYPFTVQQILANG
jgi:hypothetical protein